MAPWGPGSQGAVCGWSLWKMGLGAKGFLQTLPGVGCLEYGSEVRGVWLGILQGKSVWQGVGSSAQKSAFPCPPPCLLSHPPTYFSCPPKAATLHVHLASTETTALFPANVQRETATLSLGPASWVSWNKEYRVKYLGEGWLFFFLGCTV